MLEGYEKDGATFVDFMGKTYEVPAGEKKIKIDGVNFTVVKPGEKPAKKIAVEGGDEKAEIVEVETLDETPEPKKNRKKRR